LQFFHHISTIVIRDDLDQNDFIFGTNHQIILSLLVGQPSNQLDLLRDGFSAFREYFVAFLAPFFGLLVEKVDICVNGDAKHGCVDFIDLR